MYVHRNNDNNQPYSSVMISPSAPPINEEFFYSTSPTTNVKTDNGTPSSNLTTTTTHPNSRYHTGILAPTTPSNDTETVQEQTESIDNCHSTYHHSRNAIRSADQYDSMHPPPYQVTVPLLADQEETNRNNEDNTTLVRSSLPPPPNNIVEHNLYYGAPRSIYFSPYWFLISFSFFVFGLSLVIISIIMIDQCRAECTDLASEDSTDNNSKLHCDRVCHRGWQLAAQDGGAAITGVAGLATVGQLFALTMWQLHICCVSCRKK